MGKYASIATALVTAAFLGGPSYGAPRDVVDDVATIIENNYFDVVKAHVIAADLRTSAQQGAYDSDVFFVRDEPYRRVLFERSNGQVGRFQLVRAGGPSTWFTRVQAPAH